jgi:hypothetical protein
MTGVGDSGIAQQMASENTNDATVAVNSFWLLEEATLVEVDLS